MSRQPIGIHAATHLPGGSDPLDASGIQFSTYPQLGNWLYVETSNASGSPNGLGVEFYDHSGTGFMFRTLAGLQMQADVSIIFTSGDFLFTGDMSGTDDFVVSVGANILLTSNGGNQQIAMQDTVGIQLFVDPTTTDYITLSSGGLVKILSLPGVDPGAPGALYQIAGAVMVSL